MTTSVALSPVAILQFFDNTGKPAVGGSLLTQSGGINYATYSDPQGTTALPNPIPLNSRGEVSTAAGASSELFLQTGVAYTFTLKDAAGNQLWSIGNITSSNPGVAVNFPTASGTANAQIITNPTPISVGKGTIQWFLPVSANTATTTINVDNNGAVTALYLTKAFVGGELQVGVPAQIINDGTNWNLVQSAKGPATDTYTDTGSVNAIAVAINAAQTTMAALVGTRIKVKVANTTTNNTPTININGLGAINISLSDTATGPAAGSIILNNYCDFIIISATSVILENPSRVTGSFTVTLNGMTGTTTGTLNYAIEPSGKLANMWAVASITGTSNAVTMSMLNIPSALQPVTTKREPGPLEDAGIAVSNAVTFPNASSTFNCNASSNIAGSTSGGFTASGTKGIPIYWAIQFPLD